MASNSAKRIAFTTTSGEMEATPENRAPFRTTDLEYSSSSELMIIRAFCDRDARQAHRLITLRLDINIQTGVYKLGATDSPLKSIAYIDVITTPTGGEFTNHYNATEGKLSIYVLENPLRYEATFDFTATSQQKIELKVNAGQFKLYFIKNETSELSLINQT